MISVQWILTSFSTVKNNIVVKYNINMIKDLNIQVG